MNPTRAFVHLGRTTDAAAYSRRFSEGIEPEETPYGFHRAESFGFNVTFSIGRSAPTALHVRLIRRCLGFDFLHALSNLRQVKHADIIWTMTEGEAFAISLLFLLRLANKKPLIGNAVWLLNNWSLMPKWRKLLLQRLVRNFTFLTVHSKECIPIAQAAFPKTDVRLVFFGINTDVFKGFEQTGTNRQLPVRVLSMGNDRTRDWSTLLAAFGNDERFVVTLICGWLTESDVKDFENVSLIRASRMQDFLEAYQNCDVVIVPMHMNVFSGITVALEAVASGRPVVCSNTGGVPTYFDGNQATYVEVGNPLAMREALLDRNFRDTLTHAVARMKASDYSTHSLMRQYAALTQEALKTNTRGASDVAVN